MGFCWYFLNHEPWYLVCDFCKTTFPGMYTHYSKSAHTYYIDKGVNLTKIKLLVGREHSQRKFEMLIQKLT